MDWWNVKARDLKFGDEIRLSNVLGEQFVRVRNVDTGGASGRVVAYVHWVDGDSEYWWEEFAPDEWLTVRR